MHGGSTRCKLGRTVQQGDAVGERRTRTLYRVARRNPPENEECSTPFDKYGSAPPDVSEEKRRSWDALSAFDSEEGARRLAKQFTHLGRRIARYDILEGAGITWEQSGEEGHYDLRGDKEELKRCLTDVVDR